MRLRRLLLILLCFVSVSVFPQGKKADTEALGRALEYFQSQKYHEALLIFQRLDQSYKLNARYKAYIGLCYYYDWDYKKATEYFDTFLPKLSMLAPEERALYYYADGESHFQLGHYDQAILLFQSALTLCHDRDKGDSWFRIGFCYYFLQQPALAQGCFRLPQDRGRHIIYSFYRQASSSTNRATTSRKRTKTATGRTTTGGKPSTEGKATGRKATTSRKATTGRASTGRKATTDRATTGAKVSTKETKGNRLSLPS